MIELLTASLFITGLHACFKEGMIFFPVRQQLDQLLHRKYISYICDPLYECLTCMSSIHGTWLYFVLDVQMNFILFIFVLTGINHIIDIELESRSNK